jgi:hypothetical protein
MPSRYITFMLPFNDSNKEDGHKSDFKNIYKPKEEMKLDNNLDPNSELEKRTSFINIKEYLIEIALIEPLKLPSTKIPILIYNRLALISKLYVFHNNSI